MKEMKKIATYALTPQGASLGKRINFDMEGDLFLPKRISESYKGRPFDRLKDIVAENFSSYDGHIFIAATGIVVRAIAPLLKSKEKDPAVVVLDQDGRYVISLLSGHLGGANKMAEMVARSIGGQAVITTATDSAGLPSFDLLAKKRGLNIANLSGVKHVNMALLTGEPVQILDPEDRLGLQEGGAVEFAIRWVEKKSEWIDDYPGVWVTWRSKIPGDTEKRLVLQPRCLVAGIGCNRGTKSQEILDFIKAAFKENDLALESLNIVTTIEAKRDEEGLIEAARTLGVPLHFFSPEEIESIKVPHPSGVVKKHMGVSSVCEATALLKTGGGPLLVPKTKSRNVTLAVTLEN
jgi:cobalt-precorrin 5A hydrolase